MNKKIIKLFGAFAIIFIIVITPIVVLATNENVSVVNTQENEYMIYTQTKILSMHLLIMQIQIKWSYPILIQSQIWEEIKEHF